MCIFKLKQRAWLLGSGELALFLQNLQIRFILFPCVCMYMCLVSECYTCVSSRGGQGGWKSMAIFLLFLLGYLSQVPSSSEDTHQVV